MQYENYIGGRWTGRNFTTNVNPSDTNDEIGMYASADADDTNSAIESAVAAQSIWRAYPPSERISVLRNIGNALLARKDELGAALSREEGKPVREGIAEAGRAGNTFHYYASAIEHAQGETYSSALPKTLIQTRRNPVGTVGIITPWNFPLAIPAWKIAPALAYGNTVVFKPAELVPSSAWALTKIISEAGLPDGVFNMVMGSGSVVGKAITTSSRLNAVTFTGSSFVGAEIAADCISHGAKRIQAEMGGKNSLVVLDDADLTIAVEAIIDGAFKSTGQRCTATSRVISTPQMYPRLVEQLSARIPTLKVGDALDPSTDIGPLASQQQLNQVRKYVELGVSEGAELIAGGHEIRSASPGFYFEPTLFAGGHSQMRINQEEIFGPVVCLIEAPDVDSAIALANDTQYGLAAGIITDSQRSIERFLDSADAGMLHVNRSTANTELHVPFGGNKSSSYGPREQGTAARDFFTSTSTIYSTTGTD
ncbi:aldehyde dehydrogenase family protein [Arthrobacter sp. CAL618]|uniref:aldehyde dehydrogenase family protein n=1 Tax=Arthrobacter sp. CAL618 TaxID=1055770 RepID=UPI00041DF560|nr:aldehyde dehydrogenase family protein [Arthrobacter sp. CAL618]